MSMRIGMAVTLFVLAGCAEAPDPDDVAIGGCTSVGAERYDREVHVLVAFDRLPEAWEDAAREHGAEPPGLQAAGHDVLWLNPLRPLAVVEGPPREALRAELLAMPGAGACFLGGWNALFRSPEVVDVVPEPPRELRGPDVCDRVPDSIEQRVGRYWVRVHEWTGDEEADPYHEAPVVSRHPDLQTLFVQASDWDGFEENLGDDPNLKACGLDIQARLEQA